MRHAKKNQKPVQVQENMPVITPNAAGIDVGSAEIWVSIPPDRDEEPIRRYETFTADLYALADWLKQRGIESVAMESTGVYWIPVFEILERRGLQVVLVNAKYAKNVAGRKTDWLDCQWLRLLHTFGLLPHSFRPAAAIATLRCYLRHRQMLIDCAAAHIQHMQKALTQMNVQLTNVIDDITGSTGLRIIRAILEGERDPQRLAQMRDYRTKNDEATITRALQGYYEPQHLFALKQALELWDVYQQKRGACDQQIAQYLRGLESAVDVDVQPAPPARAQKKRRNSPGFDCRLEAYRILGVDLTQIDGISESSALTILSEIGTDMGAWKTEKHFASWLTLCPNNKISGGKILQRRTRKSSNRVHDVLCICAQTLFNSRSALGAFARRMRSRLGPQKAIVATAHKLALLIYRLLRFGKHYVDIGQDAYERQYQQRKLRALARQAKHFGFQLVAMTET
jgi:transposase